MKFASNIFRLFLRYLYPIIVLAILVAGPLSILLLR